MLGDGDVWNASQFCDNMWFVFGSGSSVQNLDAKGICGQEKVSIPRHRNGCGKEKNWNFACLGRSPDCIFL